jgi:hypothetical protein
LLTKYATATAMKPAPIQARHSAGAIAASPSPRGSFDSASRLVHAAVTSSTMPRWSPSMPSGRSGPASSSQRPGSAIAASAATCQERVCICPLQVTLCKIEFTLRMGDVKCF